MFSFVNAIPNDSPAWHNGALDHSQNGIPGYMFLVDFANTSEVIFNMTIDNLCIGSYYLFSAYMANILRKASNRPKPSVRFEVQDTNVLIPPSSQCTTGDISDYDNMTWTKYSLSFNASNSSVILLMVSDTVGTNENDLAIDDIEFRGCSAVYCDVCHPG